MTSIVVNSFPRTANVFFTSIISDYFNNVTLNDSLENMTKTILHDIKMLDDPNIKQIVIARNPIDSIVSNQIYVNYASRSDGYTLQESANYWLSWHRAVLKNMHHIYPFSFEHITQNTDQCLKYLKATFSLESYAHQNIDDFLDDLNKKQNVRQTSRSSDDYSRTKEMFFKLDKDILRQIEDSYELLLKNMLERQYQLGWIF
jgi:hypothetical protein